MQMQKAAQESSARTLPAPLLAAVDLGSNSFHLMVAQVINGEIKTLEKRGEKVQLAAGLDDKNHLTEAAIQRGLETIERFAQRLKGLKPDQVVVFGTNTLRVAGNRQEFIRRAEDILGFPIEVIGGREEARLIYLGVSHVMADEERRLVIDIGGGSTECIIGERFEAKALESLHMGCVSYTERFFKKGIITPENFQNAYLSARRELLNIESQYRHLGWQNVVASSGTAKSIQSVLLTEGWSEDGITREGLYKLCKELFKFKHIDDVDFDGLRPDRKSILAAGAAILSAVVDTFDIELMQYCDGALREGALYDLTGRQAHEDVRERTIDSMVEKFTLDRLQAERVQETAFALLDQIKDSWSLTRDYFKDWLHWGAFLHEVGLAISHTQFHKHGAYLVKNADMMGFTRQTQLAVSALVRGHRRKFPLAEFDAFAKESQQALIRLCILLRLSILFHHSRGRQSVPEIKIQAVDNKIDLELPKNWLQEHPLTQEDLNLEVSYLKVVGFELTVR